MGSLCRTVSASLLIGGGILFFALGIAVKFSIFPRILEDEIYKGLDISEGTEGYDGFVSFFRT
jgi:hypothetical protein